MPDIWFIRHAQSEANAGLPTSCPAEIRLTNEGWMQAQRIALAIPKEPSLLITSPYLRTQQTAEPTLLRFPTLQARRWDVQEFTYLNLRNKAHTTIHDRKPLVEAFWQRGDPLHRDSAGTESFVSFMKRVQGVLKRLQRREEPFIVIFSHEQFIRATMWLLQNDLAHITPRTMKDFRALLTSSPLPNGSILPVELYPGQTPRSGQIITSHLS